MRTKASDVPCAELMRSGAGDIEAYWQKLVLMHTVSHLIDGNIFYKFVLRSNRFSVVAAGIF